MRVLALVVAVLLVGATAGVGAIGGPAAEPTAAPAEPAQITLPQTDTATSNSEPTNVLAIPESQIEASDLRRHHIDLGPAVSFDTTATSDTLATNAIDRELSDLEPAEREARLREEIDALETTTEQIREQDSTAIQEFAAGTSQPRETLNTLAVVGQTADRLQDRVDRLETQLDETPVSDETESALSEQLLRIDYELRMLNGPVRSHAAAVLGAERSANRISVQASQNSIELTAIADGQYLRETYRMDRRSEGPGEVDADTVERIVDRQYPVFWGQRGTGSWSIGGPGFVSQVTMDIDIGQLQLFVDGSTEQVFIEHQQVTLDAVGSTQQTTNVQDGLEVRVNETYIGGPLQVNVTDAESGEPVDATVRVGQGAAEGDTVGVVEDGQPVWTLTPRGQFTITVLADEKAAFVTVNPQPADRVL